MVSSRIFSVFDGPSDGSGEEAGTIVPINGDLDFKNLQFSFPSRPGRMIYKDLSLSVASKESIGLVGRSGSGKSTILQIVMRFYEIMGGSATLDGQEFSSLDVNSLRQQIGYVGQLPVLFNGTVRYNILLGKPDATEEEIIKAAKAAHAYDFILNLPQVSINTSKQRSHLLENTKHLLTIILSRDLILKLALEVEC